MTDQPTLTVLQALKRIDQIAAYRPYAEDSIQRIWDIARPAIKKAEADEAIASMTLEALQEVIHGYGIECNCGDPCMGTCTRAIVLAAIAAAKGGIS